MLLNTVQSYKNSMTEGHKKIVHISIKTWKLFIPQIKRLTLDKIIYIVDQFCSEGYQNNSANNCAKPPRRKAYFPTVEFVAEINFIQMREIRSFLEKI